MLTAVIFTRKSSRKLTLRRGAIHSHPRPSGFCSRFSSAVSTIYYHSYNYWQASFGQLGGTLEAGLQTLLGIQVDPTDSTNISKLAVDGFPGAKTP
jgi:hypothetical protein